MIRTKSPVFIISAFQSNKDEIYNGANHEELGEVLNSLGFSNTSAYDFYDGDSENCYIVKSHDDKLLYEIMENYNQTNIIFIDETRRTYLDFGGGNRELVGRVSCVNESDAVRAGRYIKNGNYCFTLL